jgi:hypothetical protein
MVLALPALASADAPDRALLGYIGAMGRFCSQLQPQLHESGEKFQQALRQQFGAEVMNSPEVRQAKDRMSDALAQLGRPSALALCSLQPEALHAGDKDR